MWSPLSCPGHPTPSWLLGEKFGNFCHFHEQVRGRSYKDALGMPSKQAQSADRCVRVEFLAYLYFPKFLKF